MLVSSTKRRKPNKRRIPGGQGRANHAGRVTRPAASDGASDGAAPAPSSRYTPSRPRFRIRPTKHKVVGGLLIALGVVVGALNDFAYFGSTPLPGGHSELYLLLAVAIAAYGTWWLGLFDRPL